ncbi:MAG: DUF2163 domain-containing protein [Rhodobacteraceae bacterium]|nr:DUF2163 domain-containing protein [Paracoccaceae bacterium]
MRVVDSNLQAHLNGGATTVCRAWIVRRQDSVEYGFTDHDLDLTVDGVVCEAASGMDANTLESSTGLSVDNSQAIGALSSVGVVDADIEAGKFDSAEVWHYLVNWQDPSQCILQFRGTLGEIKRGAGMFEAELRGLSEALNKPVGRVYLRQCDRNLGDAKCGFDLFAPGFFAEDSVVQFSGRRVVEMENLSGFEDGWFLDGKVTWLTGQNAGAEGLVRADETRSGTRAIELWEETRLPITVGDTLRLHAGCDKQVETCKAKFANLTNFRGFPHMPGEDWSVSYPVSGSDMDGGSKE